MWKDAYPEDDRRQNWRYSLHVGIYHDSVELLNSEFVGGRSPGRPILEVESRQAPPQELLEVYCCEKALPNSLFN